MYCIVLKYNVKIFAVCMCTDRIYNERKKYQIKNINSLGSVLKTIKNDLKRHNFI